MKEITALIIALEEKVPMLQHENLKISKAKVGWHIQHSLMVINSIIDALKKSEQANYRWKFNLGRYYILFINKIPRGKGKAPKVVQPKDAFTKELLIESVALAKQNIHELRHLQKNHYFIHPYFGMLNLKPSIRFLQIHTQHHLNIINDILHVKK